VGTTASVAASAEATASMETTPEAVILERGISVVHGNFGVGKRRGNHADSAVVKEFVDRNRKKPIR
jgi:hypothetical protein